MTPIGLQNCISQRNLWEGCVAKSIFSWHGSTLVADTFRSCFMVMISTFSPESCADGNSFFDAILKYNTESEKCQIITIASSTLTSNNTPWGSGPQDKPKLLNSKSYKSYKPTDIDETPTAKLIQSTRTRAPTARDSIISSSSCQVCEPQHINAKISKSPRDQSYMCECLSSSLKLPVADILISEMHLCHRRSLSAYLGDHCIESYFITILHHARQGMYDENTRIFAHNLITEDVRFYIDKHSMFDIFDIRKAEAKESRYYNANQLLYQFESVSMLDFEEAAKFHVNETMKSFNNDHPFLVFSLKINDSKHN